MQAFLSRLWGFPPEGPVWLRWLSRLLLIGVGVVALPVVLAVLLFKQDGPAWLNRLSPAVLVVLWVPWIGFIAASGSTNEAARSPSTSTTSEVTVNQFTDTGADAPSADDDVTVVPVEETTTTRASTSTTSPTPQPTSTSTVSPTTTTLASTTSTSLPTSTTTSTVVVVGDSAQVVSITDGDTIRVSIGGVVEPLRLIGINTPEGGECMATEATARLTTLVAGQTVQLESDVSDRDQYDRLLRYVYVNGLFVNEVMVREGLALAHRYEPDTGKAVILEAAQSLAEADKVGMWASDACGVAATGDIRVGFIRYDADGNDNENLNDEWVEIVNQGSTEVDLTGWVVKDESASHRYNFPNGFTIGAGSTVRLHTGCGTDTSTFLYWCNTGSAIWNNGGDTVFILDPNGNIVDAKSY